MGEGLTKAAARNIFFGGSAFFFIVFALLVVHSHFHATSKSIDAEGLNEQVIAGKRVWEKHACINCHTILGEGAYYGPELGNVWVRYGGREDPEGARVSLQAWMEAMPTRIEGRRQMPNFDLSQEELDQLAAFFEWVSKIDTQGWPPHDNG